MNKLDSIYYEAISVATECGAVSGEALKTLHENARKFTLIDEPGEAARYYERVFSLWKNAKRDSLDSSVKARFADALAEYVELLRKMERHERAMTVFEAM
jgi:hypothetical protein